MSAKPTGLAAFTRNRAATEQNEVAKPPRKRAQGDTVALTVRIPRAEWARLHQLAVAEGVSLQTLAIAGLSKVFAEHGLPPISAS
jgi:predicted HicB family RNase H-like nuclease